MSAWLYVVCGNELLITVIGYANTGVGCLMQVARWSPTLKGINGVPPQSFGRIHHLDLNFWKINNL